MSKSDDNKRKRDTSCKPLTKMEQLIKEHKEENKFQEYIISHLKAEIRLLRDSLTKVQKVSKDSLWESECMNESANAKLEDGRYLRWDGEEIYYKGERDAEAYEEYKEAAAKNPNLFKLSRTDK